MSANDEPVAYCGKPIESMTREELIDALKTMSRLYKDQLQSHIRSWDTLRRRET